MQAVGMITPSLALLFLLLAQPGCVSAHKEETGLMEDAGSKAERYKRCLRVLEEYSETRASFLLSTNGAEIPPDYQVGLLSHSRRGSIVISPVNLALLSMIELGKPSDAILLSKFLGIEDPVAREYATTCYGHVADDSELTLILPRLQDADPYVRMAALQVVARGNMFAATDDVRRMTNDSDERVRELATRVFRKIASPPGNLRSPE